MVYIVSTTPIYSLLIFPYVSHLTHNKTSTSCRLNLVHFLCMFTDRCENIVKATFLYKGIYFNIVYSFHFLLKYILLI